MLFSTPSQFAVLALLVVIAWLFGFASHAGGRKWKDVYRREAEDHATYRGEADQQIRAANRRIAELERDIADLERQGGESSAAISALEARQRTPHTIIEPAVAGAVADMATDAPVPAEQAAATETVIDPVVSESALETIVAEPRVEAAAEPIAGSEPAALAETAVSDHTPDINKAELPAEAPTPEADSGKTNFGHTGYNDLTKIRGINGVLNTRLFGLGVTHFEDIEKLSAEDEMALEQRLSIPAGFIAREQWRDQASLLRMGNEAEHRERFGGIGAFYDAIVPR